MNDISKLTLSAEELQLVNNPSWILTKRLIIDKVFHLLGDLSDAITVALEKDNDALPSQVKLTTPKIAKGENYLGLPYVLLDQPRCFEAGNVFAVRTMFWWGNFFSMTLHLSGTYKKMFEEKLCRNIDLLVAKDFYLCINENQWQHHFGEDNYKQVKEISRKAFESTIRHIPFIKLAVKFPLEQWNEIPERLEKSFNNILEMLRS
jgi:hypothetical protein